MDHVLTLIAAPGRAVLSADTVATVAEALAAAGAEPARSADWLGEGEACDLPFTDLEATAAAVAARAVIEAAGLPVDVAAQPAENRRRALLVADMDATIVTGETLDELAAEAGLADRIVPITTRAMKGEIGFEAALVERVALLEGLPADLLEATWARMRLTPGAATLVATMRRHGATCVLVSGGFTWFTGRVADLVGFDAHEGNSLLIADGRLTGRVGLPILGRDAKRAALDRYRRQLGVAPAATMAVGDGANDVPMLLDAGMGVAFRGKPLVRSAVAEAGGALVDHADLTALLYLQGYRRAEFAPA